MPRVYSACAEDAAPIAQRLPAKMLVVGLCAQWCGTCNEFLPIFERLAAQYPEALFIWLDIEDDTALAGDIDVENFPSLAVFRDSVPVHFGVSLPQEGVVARLLGALQGAARRIDVPGPVAQLPALIAAHAGVGLAAR